MIEGKDFYNLYKVSDSDISKLFALNAELNMRTSLGNIRSFNNLFYYLRKKIDKKALTDVKFRNAKSRTYSSVPNYWAIVNLLVYEHIKTNIKLVVALSKEIDFNKPIICSEEIKVDGQVYYQRIPAYNTYCSIVKHYLSYLNKGGSDIDGEYEKLKKRYMVKDTTNLLEGLTDFMMVPKEQPKQEVVKEPKDVTNPANTVGYDVSYVAI